MIKLLRIDDRLVHGQVAMAWTPALGVDCLVVANDKVAKDEFIKMTLGIARPPSARLLVKSVADAITFLQDERSKPLKVLVLVNAVQDAHTLANALPEITSINFGGIRTREGARLVSKAVALTEGDITLSRELLAKGLELEVRQVPTDKKTALETLI
ncbi:PTS system, fructoselysine and glucoselysine-specific IIB component [Chitinophaga costaii]|uniref:PTS system, fructoselysine and glucoselysine-specific IIB component n=1 Tax=Chitinophaga costaii TaxID=1335309 RepID=A0A1C4CLE4_9BACT|nr:PTS sugar transporter subunit IIB [Chitinophaga costaii]PUZ27042.1 PTS mannose/fructose/sorbose transporter subunit IIB [Chitinophaga costaii]SCC19891.1 PTS system, fructoselysine and glucoselysine-specific IIB component [Chitinophaga costaii]